jgi:hypothetical protein
MAFVGCVESAKELDVHRLKILLADTSVLNESDDDEVVEIWGAMIDKYSNMSISERDEFLRTDEGKEFFECYMGAGMYLGVKLEYGGKMEGMKPLTANQIVKVKKLFEEYEKNPARFQDMPEDFDQDMPDLGN